MVICEQRSPKLPLASAQSAHGNNPMSVLSTAFNDHPSGHTTLKQVDSRLIQLFDVESTLNGRCFNVVTWNQR